MSIKKYNILKAASWYTLGNILIKSVGFFVLPIFTRLMNTHEYGIYSVYTSYLSIFETAILVGLSSTITIAKYAEEVDFESYISSIIVVPSLLAAICIAIVNFYIPMFGSILSMDVELWNCLFVTAATGAICNIIGIRLVIDGRYKLYMAYSALHTIGNVVISITLCYTVFYTHDIHLARVYGSTIISIVCALFLLIATKTKMRICKKELRYGFVWGVPLLFHTVATVMLTHSDRIMIKFIDSYASAGIYAVATTIISIPMVLQQSLSQAWTPWFYAKLNSKEYKQIKWMNNKYIVLFGGVIAGFMILAPDIIIFFSEKSYWTCIYSLLPLALCVFMELLYSIPANVEYYNKKTKCIMTAAMIPLVINIALDFVFIQIFGFVGAAYATVVSKIVMFFIHYYFAKKIDNNQLFDSKIALICVTALVGLNVAIVLTMDFRIVRYVLLLTIIIPAGWYIIKYKELLVSKFKER